MKKLTSNSVDSTMILHTGLGRSIVENFTFDPSIKQVADAGVTLHLGL